MEIISVQSVFQCCIKIAFSILIRLSSGVKMQHIGITLVLLFMSSACSTTVSPVDSGPYAPARSENKGVVAYNPNGFGDIVSMRRKDAIKRIFEICGSNNYQIVKEEVGPPKENMSESISTFAAPELKYLHFECKK